MPIHYYVTSGPMLHEIMHQWGNYFFKYDSGHWGVSGVGGGQLGGFEPSTLMSKDNLTTGDYKISTGQFRAASTIHHSGLLPTEEIQSPILPLKNG